MVLPALYEELAVVEETFVTRGATVLKAIDRGDEAAFELPAVSVTVPAPNCRVIVLFEFGFRSIV